MSITQALVKLSTEDVTDDKGELLGRIQRWGHPTGRGNSVYLYETFDEREPGIATSKINAMHAVRGTVAVPVTERVLRVEKNDLGVVSQILNLKNRKQQWRWQTHDGRLSGDATSQGHALEQLNEAVNG